ADAQRVAQLRPRRRHPRRRPRALRRGRHDGLLGAQPRQPRRSINDLARRASRYRGGMPPATRLDYSTAGESHGPAMIALLHGVPAGLSLDLDFINAELRRRQGGYGRGGRQRIETDRVRFLAGVRRGRTIGAPLVAEIVNKDSRLDDDQRTPPVHRPRPGHADLAGSVKWLTTDCRETLERASAR